MVGDMNAVGVNKGSRVTAMLSREVGVGVYSAVGSGVLARVGTDVCVSATSTTASGLRPPPIGVGV